MQKLQDTLSLMNWWIIALFFLWGVTYQVENIFIRTQFITGPLVFIFQWARAKRIMKLLPPDVSVKEFKNFQKMRKYRKWASVKAQISLLEMTKPT